MSVGCDVELTAQDNILADQVDVDHHSAINLRFPQYILDPRLLYQDQGRRE